MVGSTWRLLLATEGPFVTEEDKEKASSSVKDARPTQMYSFLPASWVGDAHGETNFLPIGNREEKGKQLLNHRTDSLGMMQVLVAKYLQMRVFPRGEERQEVWIASNKRELA